MSYFSSDTGYKERQDAYNNEYDIKRDPTFIPSNVFEEELKQKYSKKKEEDYDPVVITAEERAKWKQEAEEWEKEKEEIRLKAESYITDFSRIKKIHENEVCKFSYSQIIDFKYNNLKRRTCFLIILIIFLIFLFLKALYAFNETDTFLKTIILGYLIIEISIHLLELLLLINVKKDKDEN